MCPQQLPTPPPTEDMADTRRTPRSARVSHDLNSSRIHPAPNPSDPTPRSCVTPPQSNLGNYPGTSAPPPPRSPSMRSLPGLVTRRWMACHSMAKDRGGLVCWREQLWTICSTPRERRSERPIPRWVIHPTPLRALGVAAHPANRNNSFLLFSRVEGHHRPRARR